MILWCCVVLWLMLVFAAAAIPLIIIWANIEDVGGGIAATDIFSLSLCVCIIRCEQKNVYMFVRERMRARAFTHFPRQLVIGFGHKQQQNQPHSSIHNNNIQFFLCRLFPFFLHSLLFPFPFPLSECLFTDLKYIQKCSTVDCCRCWNFHFICATPMKN